MLSSARSIFNMITFNYKYKKAIAIYMINRNLHKSTCKCFYCCRKNKIVVKKVEPEHKKQCKCFYCCKKSIRGMHAMVANAKSVDDIDSNFDESVFPVQTVNFKPAIMHKIVAATNTTTNNTWYLTANEDGRSLANFVKHDPSWTTDGAQIKIDAIDSSHHRFLQFKNKMPQLVQVLQFDVMFPTQNDTIDAAGGLVFGWDGEPHSSSGSACIVTDIKNNTLVNTSFKVDKTLPLSFAINQYYTIKLLKVGQTISVYVNDIFLGQSNYLEISNGQYIGLWSSKVAMNIKNFKSWALTLP
jgi:hypothetical protein